MKVLWSRTLTLTASVILASLWSSAAHAAPIVVDWDVVPHDDQEIHPGDSPHYNCDGDTYHERLCYSLWDTGLTLEAVPFSFYDDKWVDGYGMGIGERSVQRIRPECKPGLKPCFDSFTPLEFRVEGARNDGPSPNLFVKSSRGGELRIPSVHGVVSFNFAGDAWERLDWLEIGFYLPDSCYSGEPPEGWVCNPATEKALIIQDLNFEPIPEPAVGALLLTGILAAARRRMRHRG